MHSDGPAVLLQAKGHSLPSASNPRQKKMPRPLLDKHKDQDYNTVMPMTRQGELGRDTPFHHFICDYCGKELKDHWVFRHEKMADIGPGPDGRKPDGKLYCHRDQLGWAKSYHQRQLRRTMVEGYDASRC